jgi:predicted transcriptional regulator
MTYRRHAALNKGQKPELTRAELEVMHILWARGHAFVHELIEVMAEPKPAYNTVSTIVRILEKKGMVAHEAFGKSHRYYPVIGREEYTQTFMHNVVGNFFDNSVPRMFSFLAEKENLSIQEIEEIIRIVQSKK